MHVHTSRFRTQAFEYEIFFHLSTENHHFLLPAIPPKYQSHIVRLDNTCMCSWLRFLLFYSYHFHEILKSSISFMISRFSWGVFSRFPYGYWCSLISFALNLIHQNMKIKAEKWKRRLMAILLAAHPARFRFQYFRVSSFLCFSNFAGARDSLHCKRLSFRSGWIKTKRSLRFLSGNLIYVYRNIENEETGEAIGELEKN